MEAKDKTRDLTRQEVYAVMTLLETEPFDDVQECDDFEDITKELFDVVDNHLEDTGLVSSSIFTFEETMTSFEMMDKKMDMRLQRNNLVTNNKELISNFEEMGNEFLTQGKKLSLMRELILQFATWQDQVGHLQQTVYSCLYLTKKKYY